MGTTLRVLVSTRSSKTKNRPYGRFFLFLQIYLNRENLLGRLILERVDIPDVAQQARVGVQFKNRPVIRFG